MKACCFTGYRPEKFPFKISADTPEYTAFENELILAITSAFSDGYDTFYCGGAMGFDLIAAELLLILRPRKNFRLVMALPYRAQNSNFSPEWRERYCSVLKQADEIVYVSDEYYKGCYSERNRYMVDRSERVIAFYDGKSGGTRDTVLYAKRKGAEVINVAKPEKENLNYTIFEVLETPENEE